MTLFRSFLSNSGTSFLTNLTILPVFSLAAPRKLAESTRLGSRMPLSHWREPKRKKEGNVEAMADLPAADDGHEEENEHHQAGNDDGAKYFALAGECGELEELIEEEEIPLGPRGGVGFGRIGGRAQFCADVM